MTGNFNELNNYAKTKNIFENIQLLYCAAFALYKRQFLIDNNINFPSKIYNAEDGVFNLECIYASAKISTCKQLVYHYRLQRKDSACYNIKDLKGEIDAFMYTFNSKSYINTSIENKILTIEKYIKGILHWYEVICSRESNAIKKFEIKRLRKLQKFIDKNINKDILIKCPHYRELTEYTRQYTIINIIKLYNTYNQEKNVKRKILKIFGLKFTLWKITTNAYTNECRLKILGLNLFKSKVDMFMHSQKIYFLNIPIVKKNILAKQQKKFIENCMKTYPDYDYYYTIGCNCGELFLALCHFNEIYSKYNSVKPVFIFDKKRLGSVYELFQDKIKIPYVIHEDCSSLFLNTITNYNNKTFVNIFNFEYFTETVGQSVKNNNGHYYNILKNHLRLEKKPILPELQCNNSKIRFISKYLEDNFVIVAPIASSFETLSLSFWEDLCKRLKAKGYNIFLNIENRDYYIKDTFSMFLSIKELAELAQYSKAIIGLRSGLLEILSITSGKQTISIYDSVDYGKFKITPQQMLAGFGLKSLPAINKEKIKEFCRDEYLHEELAYDIASCLVEFEK